jgi:hypothetical protein
VARAMARIERMKILYLHPRAWIGEYRDAGPPAPPRPRSLRAGGGFATCRRPVASTTDFEKPGDGIPTFWYNPRAAANAADLAARSLLSQGVRGPQPGPPHVGDRRAARHFRPDVIVASDGFSYAVPAAFLRRFGMLGRRWWPATSAATFSTVPEAAYGRRRTPATDRLIRDVVRQADRLRPVSPMLARMSCWAREPMRGASEHDSQPSGVRRRSHRCRSSRTPGDHPGEAIRRRYGIAPRCADDSHALGNQKGKGLRMCWPKAWPRVWPPCPGPLAAVRPGRSLAGKGRVAGAASRPASGIAWLPPGACRGATVFEHLAAADLHVNPTLCEGLNMVTVEAAAVGTPDLSVLNGCRHRRLDGEIWSRNRSFPPAAGPLADAIIRALQDPALLSACSAASRRMIADFTLDRVAEQLIALFETARRETPQTES